MQEDIFNSIKVNYSGFLEPISQISKADKGLEFISSELGMINFDKIAKEYGNTLRSPDALYFRNGRFLFLEFKDRKISDVRINDRCNKNNIKKGIKGKIYEGLSLFFKILENPIERINIKCVIICNPGKNKIENPAQNALQEKILSEESSDIDELRTHHLKKTLEDYFLPLSKINIIFEFDIILSEDKLDKFIQSLN